MGAKVLQAKKFYVGRHATLASFGQVIGVAGE
jgi:hypothetical protein